MRITGSKVLLGSQLSIAYAKNGDLKKKKKVFRQFIGVYFL